jgi:uncharacterized protein YndB with AHSA1/START domain
MTAPAPFGFDRQGKLYENGTIVFERLLPGPIESVWEYIVDGEKRAKWLTGGDIPSVVGTSFTMTFNHTQLSGEVAPERFAVMREPMPFEVELLRIEPPHHVSFTWPETDYTGTVDIDLKPFGDKVLLRLTHHNPVIHRDGIIGYLGGWHTHLMMLEDKALGRKPRPFWTSFADVETGYLERFKDRLQSIICVELKQAFEARPEHVFQAWLDPAMIAKFIVGPEVRDEKLIHIEVDATVGGRFSFKVNRGGEVIDHVGTYYEISPPERLSFSWGIAGVSDDADSRVDIVITPTEAGCDLILTHEMDIQWTDYIEQTKSGWILILGKLAAAV